MTQAMCFIILLTLLASCSLKSTHNKNYLRFPATDEITSLIDPQNSKIGIEWTFTRDDITRSRSRTPSNQMYREWFELINRDCASIGCKAKLNLNGNELASSIKIFFGDDFEIKIKADVGVFEVTGTPLTLNNLEYLEVKLQKIIFDTGAEIQLIPHERVGGGHTHFDVLSNFGNSPKLIRNFIVDIVNNPEIFLGPLGFDPLNAPPVSFLNIEQQQAFQEVLGRFDRGEIGFEDFIKSVRDDVYRTSYIALDDVDSKSYYRTNQSKFQLLSLDNFPDTLELRGFRPQKSVLHHRRIMELFIARITYLNQKTELIPLELKDLRNSVSYTFDAAEDLHSYDLTYPKDRIANSFNRFVVETGLEPGDYHFLLPEDIKPLAASASIGCIENFYP